MTAERDSYMKKVLIIAGKLYIGGAERVCRNIGYFADPGRFQVDYLVFEDTVGPYEPELLEKGCKIWHVAAPSEGYLRFFKGLKRLINKEHYDVVHAHTMFNSGLALRAAKQCGVPMRIAHSHSIRGPEKRSLIQNAYEKTMRRWILRDATHLIGCGEAAGEWLFGEKAFQSKGIVLLNGIDLERFAYDPSCREQIRQKHHWEKCLVIGHAGHMVPVKNQGFLLELMPELLKRRPDAKLALLGDGADRPALEQRAAELGLTDHVTFTGNVQNVNEYLSAMDVFAFPSLYEGMPLSIIEAQANGLPCVLSDRVPKDVYLTELVRPLSLYAGTEAWVAEFLHARRKDSNETCSALRTFGLDTKTAMDKIYSLYAGNE